MLSSMFNFSAVPQGANPTYFFKDGIPFSTLNGSPRIESTEAPVWLTPPMFHNPKIDWKHGSQTGDLSNGATYDAYLLEQITINPPNPKYKNENPNTVAFAAVLEITLPYWVKHLYAFPITARIMGTMGEDFRLEPEFAKHFSVKTIEDEQVTALEALHPNTMFAILDEAPHATIQYYKNKIVISSPFAHSSFGNVFTLDATLQEFLNKINTLFGISDDIVKASRTIKVLDTKDYKELSYKKEMKTARGCLGFIIGGLALIPLGIIASFIFL